MFLPLYILRSFNVFGDVLDAIASERAYIPYHNSKLTQILQPVLNRNNRMFLIANVGTNSGDNTSFDQDEINALNFADKCWRSFQ